MPAIRIAAAVVLALVLVACSGGGSTGEANDVRADALDASGFTWLDAGDGPDDVAAPPDGRTCWPGECRCRDERSPYCCAADGSAWVAQAVCAADHVCSPFANGCVRRCAPADRECVDDTTVWTCSAFGWLQPVACPAETPYCKPGGECAPCRPGQRNCGSPEEAEVCGDWTWENRPCGANERCTEELGHCVPCTGACAGPAALWTCPDEGYPVAEACEPGDNCRVGLGCVTCLEGDRRCLDGTEREVCGGGGTAWEPDTPCPAGSVCRFGAEDCLPCGDGAELCVNASTAVRCDGDGGTFVHVCDVSEVCFGGRCTEPECAAEVILLIDRSGSMSGDPWAQVEASVVQLVTGHPDILFKLLWFAGGDADAPMAAAPQYLHSVQDVERWFARNLPGGATPLQPAVLTIAQNAGLLWTSLGAIRSARYLIVLSDGAGNVVRPSFTFPVPGEPTGDPNLDGLAAGVAYLFRDHGVRSHAIGYNYGGAQLETIVANGGSGAASYFTAGDEASLVAALEALIADPKFCEL